MNHPSVLIVGAGTMGAGIAQVAAAAGWSVWLKDVDDVVVTAALEQVVARLDRLVEKGRLDPAARDEAVDRLRPAPDDLPSCDLVIEAIVEDLEVKAAVLSRLLPSLDPDTLIATNTSSLSVTAIGQAIGEPRRTVGMHFFNPAPLMKLVEVIPGAGTDPTVVDRVVEIATAWGKKVARATDVPGFIVNHVARPYYLEAFRILEDRLATPDVIDGAMKRLGGFRMGPLELTDLIGQDVNTATTRSVWEQLDHPPLLHPSRIQEQLVKDGHLGRKVGRGVYAYGAEAHRPALEIECVPLEISGRTTDLIETFVEAATDERGTALEHYVFARILVALIAQAAHAHERGVATREDIDVALQYGVNYPAGPFAWAERIGPDVWSALLQTFDAATDDHRFALPGADAHAR